MKQLILFFLTVFATSFLPTKGAELSKEDEEEVLRQVRSSSEYIVLTTKIEKDFVSYANNFAESRYFLEDFSCTSFKCSKWKETLKRLVSDNKEAMRNYYLGCKMGYHMVTGIDVKEEVPVEILVQCYGEVYIPVGVKIVIAKEIFR